MSRKIDCRFGVAGASQYSAVFRAQRENVTRLHEIVRRRFRIGDRLEWSPRDHAR